MSLHTKLLLAAILAFGIPYWVQAQEKQRKFEINVGISSPGLHCRADRDIADFEFHFEENYSSSDYSDKLFNSHTLGLGQK